MKEKLLFLLFFGALLAAGLYFAWRAAPVPAEEEKTKLTTRLTQAAREPFIPWTGATEPVILGVPTQAGACPPGTTYFTSDPVRCLVDGTLVPVVPTAGPNLILPVPSAEP